MKLIIATTVALACFVHVAFGVDYCRVQCFGQHHIACQYNGELRSGCKNKSAKIYSFNKQEIEYILHLHNDRRNAIANGSLYFSNGYEPASRMARFVWDDELAILAGMNTRNCTFGHDRCRNTAKFRTAGQNIASISRAYRDLQTKAALDEIIIGLWFNEYRFANMSIIDKYRTQTNPKEEYGHFTQYVTANSTAVGCGLTRYNHGIFHRFYLACNYARSNVVRTTVHNSGWPGSDCAFGTDETYPALCKVGDPAINPNYLF